MQRKSKLAALIIWSALGSNAVFAEDKPAAIVNGVSIPQERVDFRLKIVIAQAGQQETPEIRKAVRDDLINIELMSQEAVKKGLEKDPDTVQQLIISKQTILFNAFAQNYVKTHPISDEVIAKEYENLKSSLGPKEYRVRHILVGSEGQANALAEKLIKGGKNSTFEKLATLSKDASTKDKGGDLGWIPINNIANVIVKPIADAVLGLTKGQMSSPVKTSLGWDIVKLDDVRDLKMPPLSEIKSQLTQRLQQESLKQYIADLRSKTKVD